MAFWENELSFWIWLIPDLEFQRSSEAIRNDLATLYGQNIDFPLHLTIGKLNEIKIDTIKALDNLNSEIDLNKFKFIRRIQPNNYFNSFVYIPKDKIHFNKWVNKTLGKSHIIYEREADPHISLSYGQIRDELLEIENNLSFTISMLSFVIAVVNEEKKLWQIIYPK